MTTIVILSDTHGLLRPEAAAYLKTADCILHAGDVDTYAVAEAIRGYGRTYLVRGNNDTRWAQALPRSLTLTVEGVRFFLVHNKADVPIDLPDIDVVVYGHSHKYAAEEKDGILWLNPGSCGKRRFRLPLTLCRMTVEAGQYRYERIELPSP